MIDFLMAAHVILFVFSILMDPRKGLNKLYNLTLPFGVGFLYISVVQANMARANLGFGLTLGDIEIALVVSFMSYLLLVIGHRCCDNRAARPWFTDKGLDMVRLSRMGFLCFLAGALGYYLSIRLVGGLAAYMNLEDWTGDLYEASGYVYMLKYATFGAVGLWLVCVAFDQISKPMHGMLVLLMLLLLAEAVQLTARGNTIRICIPIIAWIYFVTSNPKHRGRYKYLGYTAIGIMVLLLAITIIILPEFRDNDRSVLTSDTTLNSALSNAKVTGGSSRGSSENGGEFDTGVRIIKRVNEGEINPPGPWHIARWLWNVVPRALVPDKHEIFLNWAGKDSFEVREGSASYQGCNQTGWGEAYGMMGWLGASIYWFALGWGIKKFEAYIGRGKLALMVTAIAFGPFMQLAAADFWAGAMNSCFFLVPVVVIYWYCQLSPAKLQIKALSQARTTRQTPSLRSRTQTANP